MEMNENQTVKDRLIIFIDYLGISVRKFEIECGLKNSYVNNIRKSITDDKLKLIADHYPNLNLSWLVLGHGEMILDENANITCEEKMDNSQPIETPVIPDDIIMKQGIDVYEYMKANRNEVEKLRLSHIFPPFDMFYRVISDGMRPQVEKGDILALKILNNKTKVIDGECYLIDSANHGFIIRRLHYRDGVFVCESNLQELGTMEIAEEEVFNVFAIVGLLRLRVTPHAEEVRLLQSNERKGKVIEEMLSQHSTMLSIINEMNKKQSSDIAFRTE